MLTITEQAEAILLGKQFDLVCSTLKKNTLEPSDYTRVITITGTQLKNYLIENYELLDLVSNSPSLKDGFYVISEREGFLTYNQERGCHFDKVWVHGKTDAWDQYIHYGLGFD
jgi:hypothetical protein